MVYSSVTIIYLLYEVNMNDLVLKCGVIGVVSALFWWRNRESEKREVRKELAIKYKEIRHLEKLARSVCKQQTQSSCTEAKDYIRFAEMYGASRAVERGYLPTAPTSGGLSKIEVDHVDRYRDEFNWYFGESYAFSDEQKQPMRPGKGEYESLLTFHWTVNMANDVCAERQRLHAPYNQLGDASMYANARAALLQRDVSAYARVMEIQHQVRDALLPIRSKLFGGKEDNSGLGVSDE